MMGATVVFYETTEQFEMFLYYGHAIGSSAVKGLVSLGSIINFLKILVGMTNFNLSELSLGCLKSLLFML